MYDFRFCTILRTSGTTFIKIFVSLGLVLTSAVTAICYYRIYKVVRESRNRVHGQGNNVSKNKFKSHDIKLLKISVMIFTTFLVCLSPYVIVNIIDSHIRFPLIHLYSELFALVNNSLNPVFHLTMNQLFKSSLKSLCRCK